MDAMTLAQDADLKRQRCQDWLVAHAGCSFQLVKCDQRVDTQTALQQIRALINRQNAAEYLYVLVEAGIEGSCPAYVGKSVNPVSRWRSHLQGLARGEQLYARWRERLMAGEAARDDLHLFLIGQQAIQNPPHPGFPMSVGAVEYQLIGLIKNAFTHRLLNSEGEAR